MRSWREVRERQCDLFPLRVEDPIIGEDRGPWTAVDGVLGLGDPGPVVRQRDADVRSSMKRAGLGLGAITAGALLLWQFTRSR